MAKAKKGRPVGSSNISTTVKVNASACPKCGSTERTSYADKRICFLEGTHTGQRYNQIIRKPTKCLNCGMGRIDEIFAYVISKGNPISGFIPKGEHCEKIEASYGGAMDTQEFSFPNIKIAISVAGRSFAGAVLATKPSLDARETAAYIDVAGMEADGGAAKITRGGVEVGALTILDLRGDGAVTVAGKLNAAAVEISDLAANGFPCWMLQLNLDCGYRTVVGPHEVAVVNGVDVKGPVVIYRGARIIASEVTCVGDEGFDLASPPIEVFE
jgi:hypothetical protein